MSCQCSQCFSCHHPDWEGSLWIQTFMSLTGLLTQHESRLSIVFFLGQCVANSSIPMCCQLFSTNVVWTLTPYLSLSISTGKTLLKTKSLEHSKWVVCRLASIASWVLQHGQLKTVVSALRKLVTTSCTACVWNKIENIVFYKTRVNLDWNSFEGRGIFFSLNRIKDLKDIN